MKCTICRQGGQTPSTVVSGVPSLTGAFGFGSLQKMTMPVSAPKNEAKTDIKVIPPVKVEMSCDY